MLFGLSGVELSLIIVFLCLFGSILSGYPVAFAISGSALVSFTIIAVLSEAGLLYVIHEVDGVAEHVPVLEGGWQRAILGTLSTWSQGVFSRAFGGNVETLLAVPLFVLMGIALERSNIAEELLTTMANMFGSLPGGLAISVVLVGTLLAASTGIVGATVVTMGLISLPTMLKHGYSRELATGVIATSGTLGQIIPPSIVLVLLGSIVGDMYSIGQEHRAAEQGITVLELLGEPAVLSTGTLFKAAFIPGLMLSFLYAAYAFGYAMLKPHKAPPIPSERMDDYDLDAAYQNNRRLKFGAILLPSLVLILLWIVLGWAGVVGSKAPTDGDNAAWISTGTMASVVMLGILLTLAQALRPTYAPRPIAVGLAGVFLMLLVDATLVSPDHSAGYRFLVQAVPLILAIYGVRHAIPRLMENTALRVISPPVILIVAVLGSILGGVTSPTPAAALGAAGAIILAASKRLSNEGKSTALISWGAISIVVMLVMRANFDLRLTLTDTLLQDKIAIFVTIVCFHLAVLSLVYSCWILIREGVMKQIVQETTKVNAMVFVILIGSLLLSLTIRSFGGEHYIQEFLRSFGDPRTLLLVVMGVLFLLGFVLDFIEIVFIVIPIVGPVIYAADPTLMPPEWITILIAINLQTSFITPPFGFALFYLRGVASSQVTTASIYRGVIPFVIIQVLALVILWFFPSITTFLPDLIPQ